MNDRVFGLIKTNVDVHTLGISTCKSALIESNQTVFLSDKSIMLAVEDLNNSGNIELLCNWLISNKITHLGFSYRLDPNDGLAFYSSLMSLISKNPHLHNQIRLHFFAGLPPTCEMVKSLYPHVVVFPGDEPPCDTLKLLGLSENEIPDSYQQTSDYDEMLLDFGKRLIENKKYVSTKRPQRNGYVEYGTRNDSYLARLNYCRKTSTLPLLRAHVGPFFSDRNHALATFKKWIAELRNEELLDVLSIGSSQLTQSDFGTEWNNKPNGGGVPINSPREYEEILGIASPMLVRTYAGTKRIPELAKIHEESLNISWHALSFWWFCEIDGRGDYTVLENLKHQVDAIKYIASTNKPLEPIVSHHFSFRGADDSTYIITGYLAAKLAKKCGISSLIVQAMMNNPKHTWGIQDVAKARVLLSLVKSLEDDSFKVSLQTRVGLDFLSHDLDYAKVQLAAATAMMDDIDPWNINSPEIIHVVSYSEAVHLATPDVVNESLQITLSALKEYREQKNIESFKGYNAEICEREQRLVADVMPAIKFLEDTFVDLYTAERFYYLFDSGYFPLPYMLDIGKHKHVYDYATTLRNGGICVVDDNGDYFPTHERYVRIYSRNKGVIDAD